MKRIKGIFLIIIVLLFTGCVKYDLDMELSNDKSFNLVIIDAIQEDYSSLLDINGDTSTYEELGYTVSDYEDSEYVGLKLEKKYDSIDEVSSSDCGVVELTSIIEINTSNIVLFKSSKNGSVTTYTANFTYDLTYEENVIDSEDVDYSEYSDYMKFTYNFTLPSIAENISSNADTTNDNGYSLSWDLNYGEIKSITFSFTIDENDVGSTTIVNSDDDTGNVNDEENLTETTQDIEKTTSSNPLNIFSYLGVFIFIVIVFGLVFFMRKKVSGKKNVSTGTIHHTQPPTRKS